MGKKGELALRILVILTAIALVGITVPFWIYLKWAVDDNSASGIAIYIVSAVILLILAVLGFLGSIKKSKILLLYFAIINIVMLAFGIAQIIVTNLELVDCDEDSESNFSFLCSTAKGAYYVPMAILLFINLCGGVFGIVCRHLIDNDQKGNYY